MADEGADAEASLHSQGEGDGRGSGEVRESISSQRFRGVEIIDARGNPLGEFDEIAEDIFIEEKSAVGFGQVHPRTGRPVQTVAQWAENKSFRKRSYALTTSREPLPHDRLQEGHQAYQL